MVERSILLVDDEPTFRGALALALEDEGYVVWISANPLEALALISGMRPDLILSDVMMPGLDGYALVAELRARLLQVPVILMSASGRPDCELPCVASIEKPFELHELLSLVAAALSGG